MGKSSKDKRDAYYRLAKEQNWRARSAFKLIQIDEQFDIFSYNDPSKCTRVVDLCAAPGSWSQVLSRVLVKGESYGRRAWIERQAAITASQVATHTPDVKSVVEQLAPSDEPVLKPRQNVKIVALDLQPMSHLDGVKLLQADITHPSTVQKVLKELDPDWDENNETHRVDLVISDGAPDVTGLHDFDIYIQAQLLYAALTLAIKILRPGGKFVAKIFRGRDVDLIYAQLRLLFNRVHVAKPRSSRASSLEAFVVCEDYTPSKRWTGEILNYSSPILTLRKDADAAKSGGPTETRSGDLNETVKPSRLQPKQSRLIQNNNVTELTLQNPNVDDPMRWIAPFIACGDLSGFDADATYELPAGYTSLDPVQPPTNPPYKAAQERKRAEGGAYGKTKYRESGKGKALVTPAPGPDLHDAQSVSVPQANLDSHLVPHVEASVVEPAGNCL